MNYFLKTFSSTLGKKLIMSITGLFLCTFLVIHLIGNFQLFKDDEGLAFNSYAYFMTSFLPIKIISYFLYLSIIIHAIYALIITRQNNKARPIPYAVYNGRANSSWPSRNMGILGTILLIFLVVHLSNFWAKYKFGGVAYIKYETSMDNPNQTVVTRLPISANVMAHVNYIDPNNRVRVLVAKDLYNIVKLSFKQWWYTALYVISMAALGFHLVHGFKSGFESLGWDHGKYMPAVKFVGIWGFGILIPLLFAAMPVFFYFK